jgi:hypothetical protein
MKFFNYIAILGSLTGSLMAQDIQEKNLEPFTGITASGAVNVKYRYSDTSKIVLKGEKEDFNKIEYSVGNNMLYIKSIGSIKNALTIIVSGTKLNEVTASGASNVKSNETLQADFFRVDASGASNINLTIKARKTMLDAGGASDVTLKGSTNIFDATVTGASNLKSYELISDTANVNASGASNAKLQAIKKISINATGASTVKFKGDPNDVAAEGSSSSKIVKIGGDETSTKLNGSDSTQSKTTFKFKGKNIIIIDNNDPRADSIKNSRNGSDLTRQHWQGFWMGFAGYTNPQMGFTMNNPYKYMELDYGKSYNFQWNLFQKNLNVYKKYIQLSTGLGFQFNNMSFENKTRLNADSSFTWGVIDSSNTFTYRKNRFKQTYVAVPLLLNFNTSKNLKHNLHFTCGVVGKYLLSSKTKQLLVKNSDEYTFKRKDGYNLNPFLVDAYASVGYRNLTVFAQYSLNDMFKSNKGPQVNSFSAGIRLISFD